MAATDTSSYYVKAFGWTALVLIAAVGILYPHYCDGVDPDATAYFTLARRWAAGDYSHAVNGYWSPFSIWLTAMLMKVGFPEVPAAFIQNTLGAVAFIGASISLFKRFQLAPQFLTIVLPALGFFLLHAVLVQWFSDLWGAAFALGALGILTGERFFRKPSHWIIYGLLGTLAYLAKSVYLPFFLLQSVGAVLLTREPVSIFRKISFLLVSVGVLTAACLPWWLALKAHYGFCTTGVAGALNISWGLVGHPLYRTPAPLLAPLFSDSVSFWEDPWWVNVPKTTFWDAPHAAFRLLPRIYYFFTRLAEKAALLTVLLPVAVLETIRQLFRKKLRLPGDFKAQVVQWALLLFPIPFLLIHSEVRYLWMLVPLTVIWVGYLLTDRFYTRSVAVLLALSLCVDGALYLPEGWHLGRPEKAFARSLQAQNIHGDFTADSSVRYGGALRIAYFSDMRYWVPKVPENKTVLQAQAQQAGVPYLLYNGQMERISDVPEKIVTEP